MKKICIAIGFLSIWSCEGPESPEMLIFEDLESQEGLVGKTEYLSSPFAATGDRFYMVGHQDGTFPDLGWHVEGEMGGLWMHPIKLMDGFSASLVSEDESICLDKARSFTNYPFANKHDFGPVLNDVQVDRVQFVSDGKEGITFYSVLKT